MAGRSAALTTLGGRFGSAIGGGAGSANPKGTTLQIEHVATAGLTVHEASLLGLPPAAGAVAAIATKGIVTQPDFQVTLIWQRPTGQAILGARRTGAWLAIGEQWRRLPDPLFSFAEAVAAAQLAGNDAGARLTALAGLLTLLPDVQKQGAAHAKRDAQPDQHPCRRCVLA